MEFLVVVGAVAGLEMQVIVVIAVLLSNFLPLSRIEVNYTPFSHVSGAPGLGPHRSVSGCRHLCDRGSGSLDHLIGLILLAVGGRLPHFIELLDGLRLALFELAVLFARVGIT